MNLIGYKIRPSRHFVLTWMRRWDWDIHQIRNAIENAYKIEKVEKYKYEVYLRKMGKSRKLILIKDEDCKEIFIITGAEGK